MQQKITRLNGHTGPVDHTQPLNIHASAVAHVEPNYVHASSAESASQMDGANVLEGKHSGPVPHKENSYAEIATQGIATF